MPANRRPRRLGPHARVARVNNLCAAALAAFMAGILAFGLCALAKTGAVAAGVGILPAFGLWGLCALMGLASLAAAFGLAFAAVKAS